MDTSFNVLTIHNQIVSWFSHVFSICAALSNILILVFFHRLIKKHQSMTSYYLWTTLLISTDIATCLMGASTALHSALSVNNSDNLKAWILIGNLTCITISVSFWTLTSLSYDRYRAITRPFGDKLPLKWIYAMYLAFVLVAFLVKYSSMYFEDDEKESLSTMVVSFVICESIFPLTFIIFFYVKIEKALRFNASLVVPNHVRRKQNKRALTVCKRLVQTFVLCVVPCRSATLLIKCLLKFVYVQPSEARTNLEICMLYSMAFLNLHCCANVFVYGVQMAAFRRFIRQSLTCASIRETDNDTKSFYQNKTTHS